jgi:hypothetical protein
MELTEATRERWPTLCATDNVGFGAYAGLEYEDVEDDEGYCVDVWRAVEAADRGLADASLRRNLDKLEKLLARLDNDHSEVLDAVVSGSRGLDRIAG